MAGGHERLILPLPADVVAQIKSSTAITSLTGVVLELLKNSLDAKASRIEVDLDFGHGCCSVEDDGFGIAPVEFTEGGGLGKQYYTSKHSANVANLGRNGIFLASLAAMSLLTITSHHHEHRSHNSVTFHHSYVVDRQMPVPPQHEVRFGEHGTRVAVRNLFGNLPVRVKQRAAAAEQGPDLDRLRETLKSNVTGLLLSWRSPVSIKVRDAASKSIFSFRAPSSVDSSVNHNTETIRSSPKELQYLLNVLTQVHYISICDWSNWVPASATTSSISIRGAISLQPAPTKRVQFISIGVLPIFRDAGYNELYTEVNRIFGLSNFGTVEDDVDIEEAKKHQRQDDKRFKSNGYTKRQLLGRRGVDRYPMFHLKILVTGAGHAAEVGGHYLDQETNLQAVIEVLNAMIIQWLTVHHFQPREQKLKQNQQHATLALPIEHSEEQLSLSPQIAPQSKAGMPLTTFVKPSSTKFSSRKKKRGELLPISPSVLSLNPFADWSRIKSGKPQFHENLWGSRKKDPTKEHTTTSKPQHINRHIVDRNEHVTLSAEPVLPGAFNSPAASASAGMETACADRLESRKDKPDEMMSWVDPTTKQTLWLNARTGCEISHIEARRNSDSSRPTDPNTTSVFKKSLRLQRRPKTIEIDDTPWLKNVLQSWDNPIFSLTERSIQQLSVENFGTHNGHNNYLGYVRCSHIDAKRDILGSPVSYMSKLCKDGLRGAHVVGQVDKKFILITISDGIDARHSGDGDLLVLIDQHAADERIRVEQLLIELCNPLPVSHGQPLYRSKLGHTSQVAFAVLKKPLLFNISSLEGDLFTTYASQFSAWGILFDIEPYSTATTRPSPVEKAQTLLSVTTLPPGILERCKTDPKLLISFLRSTVWKYSENTGQQTRSGIKAVPDSEDGRHAWVRRLRTCPQELIDMINSRACRSAIMFNDDLSFQQCEELVAELSTCVFPFVCAHGRPSMVPLVNLGQSEEIDDSTFGLDMEQEATKRNDFVNAWTQWKGKRQ